MSSSILAPSACRSAKRVSKEALLDCLSGRSGRHDEVRGHRQPLKDHLGPQPLGATRPTPCPLKERVHLSWRGDRRGAPSERTLQDAEGKVGTCGRGRSARDGAGAACARGRAVSPPAPRHGAATAHLSLQPPRHFLGISEGQFTQIPKVDTSSVCVYKPPYLNPD